MKPRRILLFLIVLRKVAEPIAVVEIQAIQTADLLDFVFSCGQTVLPDDIGLWLERLEHDIIPISNQPFKDFLFGVFLAEPVSPYRLFAALGCNRRILTIRTKIRVIAHHAQLILELPQVAAHRNRLVNRFFSVVVSGWHTRLVLHRKIGGRSVQLRLFYNGQLMLQADLIGDMAEVVPRLFFVFQPLPIYKGNGVDDKMAVEMFGVQMGSDDHLIPLAPHLCRKLHSDLLRLFGRDLVFLKAQIPVIRLNPVCLAELFLDGNELVTSHRHIAVDPVAEKLVFRFLLVLRIGKHIFERLIIFGRIFGVGGLFRIGRIIQHLTEPDAYLPKLCYCHFRPLFSGRRNSRSIAA